MSNRSVTLTPASQNRTETLLKGPFVLFSGIGGSDPISNNRDAASLHIVRVYKPDAVWLFLTKDMAENEAHDQRYTQAIYRIHPACEIKLIPSHIEDPSDFDVFLEDFKTRMTEMARQYPEHQLLVNVSSGTPQMLNALCLEALTLQSENNRYWHPVQVTTPKKGSNHPRSFNLEESFQQLEEKEPGHPDFENRTKQPKLLHLRRTHLVSQLRGLILQYEYAAAEALLKPEMALFDNNGDHLLRVLQHLKYRLYMQHEKAKSVLEEINLPFETYPILSEEQQDLFEYYWVLRLTREKGNLSDFVLKLTPLVCNLLEIQVKKYYPLESIVEDEIKNGNPVPTIIRGKIEQNDHDLLMFLDQEYQGKEKNKKFEDHFVNTDALSKILKFISKQANEGNSRFLQKNLQPEGFYKIRDILGKFRDFEKKMRDKTAHELFLVTEEEIQKLYTGKTSEEICSELETLLQLMFPDIEVYPIYDKFNEYLLERLGS